MTQPKVRSEWALFFVQAHNSKSAGGLKGSLLSRSRFLPVEGEEYKIEDAPGITDLDHSKNFGHSFSIEHHQVPFKLTGILDGFSGWIVEMGRAGYGSDLWTVEGVTNSFGNQLHYFVATINTDYGTGKVAFYR